ncbi:MAG: Phenylalanine--tRNA ligase alpha subunit, partial [Thermodesulfobacteriota bacterium]|nr:Phenylalanine--tRNA ligase alpha subunit [Thermodesulfobacteriota bacterium]
MKEQLLELEARALKEIDAIADLSALEQFRIRYLGKKGQLTSFMKRVGGMAPEERPEMGRLANLLKRNLSERFEQIKEHLSFRAERGVGLMDLTLPGREPFRGHLHPITRVIQEVCRIFSRMGFRVVKGPNVELDYYNFEALNIPRDHPARDMQDTFYISDNIVLRTHTSPMQVRVMESRKPPVSIIAPGKVYRRDSDVTHTPMFHQVEGLLVDEGVTFGDLKGTLSSFVHQMFGSETRLR